jgi:type I restriction enzyme S subunit
LSDQLCLGDVITLEYGRSLPSGQRRPGSVPVYGSNGITGWHDVALIEGPVIVVGRKGSIGEVQYEPGPAFPIDTTYYALPRPGISADFRYLFYMLRVARLTELNSATGVPGLNREHAYRVLTRLPPLDEQRRIVGLLDRAEEIRCRADAARAKARAIIPALFLDTFGDPAANPKGWPEVELGDIIVRITGGKNIEAGNGTSRYRIMKVSAVTSGIFRPNEAKPAPDNHVPAQEHHVRDGDFLFSRANTSELVGAVAIAHEPPDGLLLPDKIWRIEWDPQRIEPQYAYSLLRSSEVRRIFALIGSGTSASMKNISQGKLVRVSVPLPPLTLQTTFAEQVHRLESLARHLDAAANKAEAMAAGLSAEVFA